MRWGFHLCLDIAKCIPPAIRCPKHIECFTKKLVKEIDMKAYGEPQIVHFGSGNKAGYTLVQLIETSNITAHFCEESNDAYIDIFSCKPFDIETAKKVVQIHFQPKDIKIHYMERQASSIE